MRGEQPNNKQKKTIPHEAGATKLKKNHKLKKTTNNKQKKITNKRKPQTKKNTSKKNNGSKNWTEKQKCYIYGRSLALPGSDVAFCET